MSERIGSGRVDKLFSISLVLLPFLYQYKGIGEIVSLGELIVAALMAIELLMDHFKLYNLNNSLLAFYLISLGSTILCVGKSYFVMSAAMTVFFRLVFYAIVVVVARRHFLLHTAFRIYTVAVFAFSLYLIIQFVYHYVTDNFLPIYLRYSWQFPPEAREENLSILYRWNYRASSLFLEPSYYTLYVLPSICILLFKDRRSRLELITLLVAVIAIALSTASSGIGGLFVVFIIFVSKRSSNKSLHRFVFRSLVIIGFIVGMVLFFAYSDKVLITVGRILNGGSFNNRITRGLLVFARLPVFHQLFGVGINNLEPYIEYYGLYTAFDEANLNYSASVVQTLNYSGVVGLFSLFVFLVYYWKYSRCKRTVLEYTSLSDGNGVTTALFFLIVFIICYESIMFTYRFAFLITLYEAVCRQQSQPVSYNRRLLVKEEYNETRSQDSL